MAKTRRSWKNNTVGGSGKSHTDLTSHTNSRPVVKTRRSWKNNTVGGSKKSHKDITSHTNSCPVVKNTKVGELHQYW